MATTTASRSRMLAEALTTVDAARAEKLKRAAKAAAATDKALDQLAALREQWFKGEATLQDVRRAVVKAHNDIMRSPSQFAIDQAEHRENSARSVVTMLEKEDTDA